MSARRVHSTISTNDYTYVNEDQIDSKLKCIICQQPFVKPIVGKRCGHTFCNDCINNWLQQHSSCPSCRQNTSFEPVTTRIVLSQLDRLLVRCRYCNKDNIERGNFNDHIQHQCRKVIVKCNAADLKCYWTGSREEQAQHADICPLLQIRPIVEELRAEIAAQAYQLQIFRDEIRHLQNQPTHPLQSSKSTINSVVDGSEEKRYQQLMCSMERTWQFNKEEKARAPYSRSTWDYGRLACSPLQFNHKCYGEYCNFCNNHSERFFQCMVCSCKVARDNVRAHDSSSKEYAVICLSCFSKYSKRNQSQ